MCSLELQWDIKVGIWLFIELGNIKRKINNLFTFTYISCYTSHFVYSATFNFLVFSVAVDCRTELLVFVLGSQRSNPLAIRKLESTLVLCSLPHSSGSDALQKSTLAAENGTSFY